MPLLPRPHCSLSPAAGASAMGLPWGLLLLALALGGLAAARCPTPCVCDNLRAQVLCLHGNLTAIPEAIPQVSKGTGRGWGKEVGWQPSGNSVFCFCD